MGTTLLDHHTRRLCLWGGQKQSFENVQADRRYGWVEGSEPYGIPLATSLAP
ncbi:MAG: hypothetical protein LW724_18385 [Planctomycetaceae bacterium]|jgi:hypothetical protein|nr:hypothetical protein [Planctomycetaceae bacterium]